MHKLIVLTHDDGTGIAKIKNIKKKHYQTPSLKLQIYETSSNKRCDNPTTTKKSFMQAFTTNKKYVSKGYIFMILTNFANLAQGQILSPV